MCVTGFCHGPERPRRPWAICFWPAASWELFILAPSILFASFSHFCHLAPRRSCSISCPLILAQWSLLSITEGCTCILLWDTHSHPHLSLLTGNSWGVTQNHAFSLFIQTVSITSTFHGTQRLNEKKSCHRYLLLNCICCCVWWRWWERRVSKKTKKETKKKTSWRSRCAVCCACMWGSERKRGKRFKDKDEMCDMR